MGVISKEEALKKAQEREEDLVLIAEASDPPVAKIMDFKKFLYEQKKKAQQAKSGAKKSKLKEFKFGPTIDDGDLKVRIERSRKFLEEGNKVRVTVQMRGRENAYPALAEEKLKIMLNGLKDVARVEGDIEKKGTMFTALLVKL